MAMKKWGGSDMFGLLVAVGVIFVVYIVYSLVKSTNMREERRIDV